MKFDLNEIKDPSFIKDLTIDELKDLAACLRDFIIDKVSKNGGHLASNLGSVELILGMHYVFDCHVDKFIFDVSHQSYVHKILTGRGKDFDNLRKYNGLSGFASYKESSFDHWESGHSSTSLAAQAGYLLTRKNKDEKVISLIGDASINNGIALEALNYMGSLKGINPIIILNDNNMSISPSKGFASRSFSKLRTSNLYQKTNNFFANHTPTAIRNVFHRIKGSIKGFILQDNYFEDMGFDYMGPYDGNNIKIVIKSLKAAKKLNKPCIVHFVTKKGKGYSFAENDKIGLYHGVNPFSKEEGVKIDESTISNSLLVANTLLEIRKQKEFSLITPAMIRGSELEEFLKEYPSSLIDVGINEELAASLASSMSRRQKVVLTLYSTFAQRSFDFLLNDICRTNSPVTILIDRADIVPTDGDTHQGIYDLAMFSLMPNVSIYQGRNQSELRSLIKEKFNLSSPTVIRYSKDSFKKEILKDVDVSKDFEIVKEGKLGLIISYGENVDYVLSCLDDNDLDFTLINVRRIKPIAEGLIDYLIKEDKPVLIYENVCKNGSLGEAIASNLAFMNFKNRIIAMAIDDNLTLPCGTREELRTLAKLNKDDILKNIKLLNKN